MSKIILSDDEISSLRDLTTQAIASYDSPEDPEFLAEAPVLAHEMPRRVRKELIRFRLEEPESGLLIISGYPVDEVAIGPTPAHWLRPAESRSPTLEQEVLFVLMGSLLGECVGWSTQQGGRIVHDVLPIKGMEDQQIGTGSEQVIWWHTEDAFHPSRGDYVGMMCLRNLDRVPTTCASLSGVRLEPEEWNLLFEPLYTIQPDQSHRPQARGEGTGDAHLDELYRRIEEMRRSPENIAILSGDRRSPYIRIDPFFMDPPDDPRARKAMSALVEAIDRELQDVVLAPGDMCFIDNFKAVHGRRAFKARYDGKDRWLKRINITRDLRKSRADRLQAGSRVIL